MKVRYGVFMFTWVQNFHVNWNPAKESHAKISILKHVEEAAEHALWSKENSLTTKLCTMLIAQFIRNITVSTV
jgi:hypothetical protein